MARITLKVFPHNFASSPPFAVENEWRPRPVTIHHTTPPASDVIAAALPTAGGMRVVVYNREDVPIEVTMDDKV